MVNIKQTEQQYDQIVNRCRTIFLKKTADYGTSWRIFRTSSLTDQIFIKAQRIRTIEETGENKVNEPIEDEYCAIVNYCIIALIQLKLHNDKEMSMSVKEVSTHYDKVIIDVKTLMLKKNHDYGEAWRDMRSKSLTDMILSKLLRIKQIEDNKGETIISEGIDANYHDIINYAIFALIKLEECK